MTSEFTCQEMTEVVTDYLDEALPSDDQQRFERHLTYCAGCSTYTEQIRETIKQAGLIPREQALPAALRDEIVAQFRSWKQS